MPKSKYLDMVAEAVFTLGERKGSSAQAIWKYLQVKHPESVSDVKIFRVQLKRVAAVGRHVEKAGAQRYKLSSTFRGQLVRWAAKADAGTKRLPPMAMEHAMTTKTKNERKTKARLTKAAKSKVAAGRRALAKSKKRAATKAKAAKTKERKAAKKASSKGAKGGKPKSTKAKRAANKKAKSKASSSKAKKNVSSKAKAAAKKVAVSKQKN